MLRSTIVDQQVQIYNEKVFEDQKPEAFFHKSEARLHKLIEDS